MLLKSKDYQTITKIQRSHPLRKEVKEMRKQGLLCGFKGWGKSRRCLLLFNIFNFIIRTDSMNKNSLVTIIYQKSLQRSHSQRLRPLESRHKQKIISNNKNPASMSLTASQPNQLIKITQFDSGLHMKNRFSVPATFSPHHISSAPAYRHFTVKKLKDIKSVAIPSISMAFDLRTHQKQCNSTKYTKHLRQTTKHQGEDEPVKILVTSKWKFRHDLWDLGMLGTNSNECQSVVVVKPQALQKKEGRSNSRGNVVKRKEIKQNAKTSCSKDRLGLTADCRAVGTSRDKEDIIRKVCDSPRKRYVQEQKRYQENVEKQKKQMLETRKELNKNYAKPFNPPENVSAFAYIIYETDPKKKSKLGKCHEKKQDLQGLAEIRKLFLNSHKVVVSLNSRTAVEIASLTKIMTCITAIDIVKRFSLRIEQESVVIGAFEENIGGTSANIKKGQIYSVYQLLHGLMLPSGNDASLAIAVWGGRVLLERAFNQQKNIVAPKFKKKECFQRFILEMNSKAISLNMQKTKYCNSHGLSNPENRSCCYDLGILSEYAMYDPLFREIVSCRVFQSEIKMLSEGQLSTSKLPLPVKIDLRETKRDFRLKCSLNAISMDQKNSEFEQMKDMQDNIIEDNIEQEEQPYGMVNRQLQIRHIRWQNTHQLVQKRPELYVGIKTGVTTTAGPCLASCLQVKGRRFIIVVLNCKSMKHRIKDTQILRKWLYAKEGIKAEPIIAEDLKTN